MTLEEALKHYFGHESFRPGQRPIVEAALAGRDQLVVMPTGAGKSLCYQLPAVLGPGVTIVVSPLIALMQDQVEALRAAGVGATFLNSTLSSQEAARRRAGILKGEVKLVYAAPERLLNEQFLPFLDRVRAEVGITAIAIDEAHCISEWGHDFRPEYRQLRAFRARFPGASVMALTATATERVRGDIVRQLALREPRLHLASFNRPNLYYEVRPKERKPYEELRRLVREWPGAGIIYCLSRARVEDLAARLREEGIAALPYHAGMGDQERAENQTRFIRDDARVMVATIAFGMGIHKPDVRFVIHYDLPRNLEGYYQESGRAGRDGEPARCLLFFGYGDLRTVEFLIAGKSDPDEQKISRQQLRRVIDYAEGTDCRRRILLGYFGETLAAGCEGCDNCARPREREDWTVEAQKLLSCVARCEQRFGLHHIIAVLRGSLEQRVIDRGHNRLSTYGIGRDRSESEWLSLGRSLLHQGLLEETEDGYPILKLNLESRAVLRGERRVEIAIAPRRVPTRETSRGGKRGKGSAPAATRPGDAVLLERLRALRKQIADESNVPPYVVFPDASLRAMAEQRPRKIDAFALIPGVGAYKLEHYGPRFIALINAHGDDGSRAGI
jgi:ATP-dependent DNA helicase RecQ